MEFAVVDVETTGLFPARHDRVVEIGIVGLDAEGSPTDSWCTVVNPGRDVGPTEIHGLRGRDVESAPMFAEIVGDVSERLTGRVLVAHNARFDSGFLAAEFARAGYRFPDVPWMCTMELGSLLTGARGLRDCCVALEITHDNWHSAIDDAHAAGGILCLCMGRPDMKFLLVDALFERPLPSQGEWPRVEPCRRTARRGAPRAAKGETYLAGLLARLPPTSARRSGAEIAYLDLLDRVLEDRVVTTTEADALRETASEWGLTAGTIDDVHRLYVADLVRAALQDAFVTDAERTDLEDVAQLLTIATLELDAMLDTQGSRPTEVPHETPHVEASLVGQSVCFTGQLTCTIRDYLITREHAEALARDAGLIVMERVTKKLDVLVVADPDSMSGKARKAREYGTRIMVERAFWKAIGAKVD